VSNPNDAIVLAVVCEDAAAGRLTASIPGPPGHEQHRADPFRSWQHPRLMHRPARLVGSGPHTESAVVSPFVSPSPRKRPCRAKTLRNHNPRVGGSSPSSGMVPWPFSAT
jgi:hypothetical protein